MDLRSDIIRMVNEITSTAILKKVHRVVKLLYDAQRGRG